VGITAGPRHVAAAPARVLANQRDLLVRVGREGAGTPCGSDLRSFLIFGVQCRVSIFVLLGAALNVHQTPVHYATVSASLLLHTIPTGLGTLHGDGAGSTAYASTSGVRSAPQPERPRRLRPQRPASPGFPPDYATASAPLHSIMSA